MKVIDLLNKIANGEKVPKQIICYCYEFQFDEPTLDYFCEEINEFLQEYLSGEEPNSREILNKEVKIIQEEEDKEIKKAKFKLFENIGDAVTFSKIQEYNEFNIKELKRVTDELVREVNKLKKEGKE